jgi:hypothetical protein
MTINMYDLAICEIIHPAIHGGDLHGHYMLSWFISYDEFMSSHYKTMLESMKKFYHSREDSPPHPFLRRFWSILASNDYYRLHIVEGKQMVNGEHTAILKTFWLRIFQRKWRNICKDRQIAQKKMKHLYYRNIYGKWPSVI